MLIIVNGLRLHHMHIKTVDLSKPNVYWQTENDFAVKQCISRL